MLRHTKKSKFLYGLGLLIFSVCFAILSVYKQVSKPLLIFGIILGLVIIVSSNFYRKPREKSEPS